MRCASGSLIFKLTGMLLSVLLAVVLARVLGVENFGVYAFCMSMVQILSIPAMLGGQDLLVREMAACQACREFGLLQGILHWARQTSLRISCALALGGMGIVLTLLRHSPLKAPMLIAMALLPLLARMQINCAALRGLQHVLLSQLPAILTPLAVIIVIGLCGLTTAEQPSPELALAAQWGVMLFFAIAAGYALTRTIPRGAAHVPRTYDRSKWVRSCLSFVIAAGMQIIIREISLLLLGMLGSTTEAGLYRVAQRGAEMIPFGLMAVNMAIAPTVADLFSHGETARLQRLITRAMFAVLAFSLPVTLVLILGGKTILSLVFGPEFVQAYTSLVILCVGQFFNAFMGPVGLVLNMTGLERFTARGVIIAALTNLLLGLILIPRYGIVGAAAATACSVAVWNIVLAFWLYRKTGILSMGMFRL